MQNKQDASVGEQVVTSTLWMGSWRWSARLIGFVTTIILARLLLPEDFGIVATGAIIVGFFTIMIDLGTDSYLIPLKDPDRDDYDTAWTLRLLVITAASMAIFFAAQPGADYFEDQRLVDVLRLLAVTGWIGGLTNIGLVMYRRDLQFRKIAYIGITKRLVSSTTTIVLAFWLQNYWAMVIGEIVFMLIGVLLSYVMHSYRPRLSLIRIKTQWEFCKWIVSRNLATFMQGQGDNFVVAKFFGIELMGIYSMAARFAAMPTMQLIAPVLAPVYSGLAKKQDDDAIFVATVLKVIGATSVLLLPAATMFAVLAEPLIITILGERWMPAVPLVAPLTFSILLAVLINPVITALTIKSRVKLLAVLNWFSAISVVAVLLFVAQLDDLEVLVWVRVVITAFLGLIYYAYLKSILTINLTSLLATVYRPVIASLAMAVIIYGLTGLIDSGWLKIVAGVSVGGISYLLMAAILWRLAGSPESGEAMLVGKVMRVLMRVLRK